MPPQSCPIQVRPGAALRGMHDWINLGHIGHRFGGLGSAVWLHGFVVENLFLGLRLSCGAGFAILFEQPLKLDMDPLGHDEWVPEPVCRPDPEDRPPEPFEHRLAKLVAIARGRRGVVPGAIALDARKVAPGKVGVHDAKIDSETGYANLRTDLPALGAKRRGHCLLEGILRRALESLRPEKATQSTRARHSREKS